jgi:hypothetical protein
VTITVKVAERAPRARSTGFRHSKHSKLACATCHVEPVTLAPRAEITTCQSCHDDHHQAKTDCAACHTGADLAPAHARPVEAHRACDACHTAATVARLVPTRSLCVTCHQQRTDHYPAKECTACHFLASPEQYRAHLRKAGT